MRNKVINYKENETPYIVYISNGQSLPLVDVVRFYSLRIAVSLIVLKRIC